MCLFIGDDCVMKEASKVIIQLGKKVSFSSFIYLRNSAPDCGKSIVIKPV